MLAKHNSHPVEDDISYNLNLTTQTPTDNMTVIVDIQGFKDNENKLIPKEVCVMSTVTGTEKYQIFGQWIVSPLYPLSKLSRNKRRECGWLTRNHHGIKWNEEGTSWDIVVKNLQEIARFSDSVATRGVIKVRLLEEILSQEIINLEEIDECPPFVEFASNEPVCYFHSSSDKKTICALSNVIKLTDWWNKNQGGGLFGEDYNPSIEPQLKTLQRFARCYEYPTDSRRSSLYTESFIRCLSSRQDPAGVDETDCNSC